MSLRAYNLYAYFDETGDKKSDDGLFICGYVGWLDAMDEFGLRWHHAMSCSGTKSIHATQLLSGFDKFLGRDDKAVDELVTRCIYAIRSTIPVGLIVGFDASRLRKNEEFPPRLDIVE
jgi:hypothetical protein